MKQTNGHARYARLGALIRQARKDAGLSHDKLGERVGTSRQHLIRLEHGYHMPMAPMLAAIARETGKDIEFFETGTVDDDEDEAAMPNLDDMLRAYVRRLVQEAAAA